MTNNDAATMAGSLSEIAEAILRLATEIRNKDVSTTVIIDRDKIEEQVSPITRTEPTAAEEPLLAQAPQEQPLPTPASPAEEERPRPLRVESQVLIREPDGSRWIVSVRSYSDGQLREDRKPYRTQKQN